MPIRAREADGTIAPGLTFLKVNVKSLAAEAKINRHESRLARARGRRDLSIDLNSHRRGRLRTEARSALLAYGFLKGTEYQAIEQTCHEKPDWTAVARKVKRFAPYPEEALLAELKEWML